MRFRVGLLFSCLFLLSGAAGLVYEVCWTRLLRLPMGNTVHSMTVVLAAFMGGLAIGAVVAGRRIDRRGHPLRVYALLEAAIGVVCLALPWIVQAEEPFFRWVYRAFGPTALAGQILRFLACGLVVLVPATLMGATLPVLCRWFVDARGRIGRSVGWLYAVNALGAVLGSLLAGFVLVPRFGLRAAMLGGVATSLAVAAVAWLASRRLPPRASAARAAAAPALRSTKVGAAAALSPAGHRVIVLGYALSGLAAMVFQIAWVRIVALVVGSSVYAFALLVSGFILGLVVGSAIAALVADRLRVPVLGFAVAELGIAVAALATLPAFGRFPEWMLRIVPGFAADFGRFQLVQFALVGAVLLLPTACMGACLPFVGRALARGADEAGAAVGTAYAANTVGTILGAMLGGLALLPALGASGAVRFGAALNLVVGVAALGVAFGRRRGLVLGGAVALFGALGVWRVPALDPVLASSGAYLYAVGLGERLAPGAELRDLLRRDYELLLYREGLESTITVRETPAGVRSLLFNGKVDASDGEDRITQDLLGHVPALLHPEPRDVAVIGLASGMTAGALAQHPTVRNIECIEIAPEMVEACRLFDHVNRRVLDDPRLQLVFADGRNHLSLTDRQFDLIVSEPSNPWIAGVASLFTREFLEACRDRLRPGGLLCLWVQFYGSDLHTLQSVARTFVEVFPSATLWESIPNADYLFVGAVEPLRVGWEDLAARLREPRLAADLEAIALSEPSDLLAHHVADGELLRQWAAPGEVYRDDTDRLEFTSPRLMHREMSPQDAEAIRALARPRLPGWLVPPAAGFSEPDRARLEAAFRARDEIWRGFVAGMRGRPAEALTSYVRSLELCPHLLASVPSTLLDAAGSVSQQAMARGDTAAALAPYTAILARAPRIAGAYRERGTLLGRLGRLAEAERDLRAAAALEPRNAALGLDLAAAIVMQGRAEAGEAEVRRVLGFRPHDAAPRISLGNLLLARGDWAGAGREYRSVVDRDPESAEGWLLLGKAAWAGQDLRAAAAALERAVRCEPDLGEAHALLARVYEGLGDAKKAANARRRAATLGA